MKFERLDNLIAGQLEEDLILNGKQALFGLILGPLLGVGFFSYLKSNPSQVFTINLKLASLSFTLSALIIVFITKESLDVKLRKPISNTARYFISSGVLFLLFIVIYQIAENYTTQLAFIFPEKYIGILILVIYFLPCYTFGFGLIGLYNVAENLSGISHHIEN